MQDLDMTFLGVDIVVSTGDMIDRRTGTIFDIHLNIVDLENNGCHVESGTSSIGKLHHNILRR